MSVLFLRLLSLGAVTVDLVIWAIWPRSFSVVAAWLCASALAVAMVWLIIESRQA